MDSIYQIKEPGKIFSPGLVVFRELVEQNVKTMIAMAGGVDRLRPHCKTHKMPEVIKLQQDLGISRFKVATFAEAEMVAEAGAKDIFLAYNLVGPNIERAVNFRRKFPHVRFAVTADDVESIQQLGQAIAVSGKTIDIMLDINPGRDRTGLPIGDEARSTYELINKTPGLVAAGLHLYDGHLREPELAVRKQAVSQYWEQIAVFRDELLSMDLPVPKITCGGTPTFPAYTALSDPAIEFSPGTCIFHDAGYGGTFSDLEKFTPAALVLTRVISRPTANRVTFDLGTKAIASDPPMGQRAVLPDLPDAVQVLQNEEHLVVETEQANQFRPGDWTLAIPEHVCPTSALHKSATVISNGEIVGEWLVVARDRCLTI